MKQIILEKDLNNLNEAIDKLNDEFETVYKDKSVFEKNKILDIKFLINQVRIDLQDENMQTLSYILDRNSKLELITFKGKREKDVFYFNIDNSIIMKQGEFLLLFLNADFSSDDLADNTFYNHFDQKIRNILKQFNTRQELLDFQYKLRKCVDYIYTYETDIKTYEYLFLEYLSNTLEKINIYKLGENILVSFNTKINKINDNGEKENQTFLKDFGFIHNLYKLDSINQLLYIMINNYVSVKTMPIKECNYCGKLFIPQTRNDEVYCNNLYKETGKTCRELGAWLAYKKNLEEDSARQLYVNMKKRKYMKTRRNPNNKDLAKEVEVWKEKADIEYKKYKKHEITSEEFENWLNQNY